MSVRRSLQPTVLPETPTPCSRSKLLSAMTLLRIPFTPVYEPHTECAQELANKTLHDILRLGWVPTEGGDYELRMAPWSNPTICSDASTWPRSSRSATWSYIPGTHPQMGTRLRKRPGHPRGCQRDGRVGVTRTSAPAAAGSDPKRGWSCRGGSRRRPVRITASVTSIPKSRISSTTVGRKHRMVPIVVRTLTRSG